MNTVIIKGNITRDPELRYLPNGTPVCGFGIAVNEKWTGDDGQKKERVDFFDVEAWSKRGETVAQWFKKGNPILITGKLKQETWDDKQTGQKRSKIKIVLQQFDFCGGKIEGNGQAASGEERQDSPNHEAAQDDPGMDGDRPF